MDIALKAGAHVIRREGGPARELFAGDEAEHKNWAIRNIRFKYPWIFHIDADERMTPELVAAVQKAVSYPGEKVAFRVRRRDFLADRWLKHVQASPFYLRLFRPDKMKYERLINPASLPDGPVGQLAGYLDHYPFSKGMTHWLSKHNSYSSLEAQQIVQNRKTNQRFSLRQALLAEDPNQRRFHQKELFYRMPARPFTKFLLLYVGKCGFLDGSGGFTYALLQSFYEYMIVLKTKELTRRLAGSAQANQVAAQPHIDADKSEVETLHANSGSSNSLLA
jgi:hypothetical protein